MKEFVLIFRVGDPGFRPTPEQLQQRAAWLAGLAARNKLADPGHSFSAISAATLLSNKTVTDGPFIEVRDFVSGFMVLQAETLAEAIELAGGNPLFEAMGGSIEVREVVKR